MWLGIGMVKNALLQMESKVVRDCCGEWTLAYVTIPTRKQMPMGCWYLQGCGQWRWIIHTHTRTLAHTYTQTSLWRNSYGDMTIIHTYTHALTHAYTQNLCVTIPTRKQMPMEWSKYEIFLTSGHLEILKWARANGCKWDESTCAAAARNGHLEVVHNRLSVRFFFSLIPFRT